MLLSFCFLQIIPSVIPRLPPSRSYGGHVGMTDRDGEGDGEGEKRGIIGGIMNE